MLVGWSGELKVLMRTWFMMRMAWIMVDDDNKMRMVWTCAGVGHYIMVQMTNVFKVCITQGWFGPVLGLDKDALPVFVPFSLLEKEVARAANHGDYDGNFDDDEDDDNDDDYDDDIYIYW